VSFRGTPQACRPRAGRTAGPRCIRPDAGPHRAGCTAGHPRRAAGGPL